MEIYFACEIANEIIWNCSPVSQCRLKHFISVVLAPSTSKILGISMNFLVNRDLFWLNAAAPELFSTLRLTFPLSLNSLLKPNLSMSAIGNRDHLTNCWKIKNYHTWCQQTSDPFTVADHPNPFTVADLSFSDDSAASERSEETDDFDDSRSNLSAELHDPGPFNSAAPPRYTHKPAYYSHYWALGNS
jgi:hypothetical protein